MKRLNSVTSLILIFTLLCHIFTTMLFLITGFRIELLNNIFARTSYGLFIFHMIISFIILLKSHDAKPLPIRYTEYTYRIHIQRFTGLLMVVFLHSHISQMVLVLRALPMDSSSKIKFCVINIIFFVSIFSHIAASFTRVLISIGVLVNNKTIKKIDSIVFVSTAILFIFTSICIIFFAVNY